MGVIIVFKEVCTNILYTIIINKENIFHVITHILVQRPSTIIVDVGSTNSLKRLQEDLLRKETSNFGQLYRFSS